MSPICPERGVDSGYGRDLRPPTRHVYRVERARGPVWYAKYRLPDGRQVQKKVGPAGRAVDPGLAQMQPIAVIHAGFGEEQLTNELASYLGLRSPTSTPPAGIPRRRPPAATPDGRATGHASLIGRWGLEDPISPRACAGSTPLAMTGCREGKRAAVAAKRARGGCREPAGRLPHCGQGGRIGERAVA